MKDSLLQLRVDTKLKKRFELAVIRRSNKKGKICTTSQVLRALLEAFIRRSEREQSLRPKRKD